MDINKLKGKRVENGYTQKTLSEAIGISEVTYRKKEKGTVVFTNNDIAKLKELLNLTPEDVVEIFL